MGDDYLQWNIRGLLDRNRRHDKVEKVVSFLEKPCNLKILNIQETHLITTEDEPSAFRNFEHLFHIIHNHATPDDRSAGICIFINKTEDILLQQNLIEGRLTYLKLKNSATEEVKNIFSYYGKSRSTGQEWTCSFQKIQEEIVDNNMENIIIIGDFNFVTSTLDRNSNQLNSIDITASQAWTEVMESCGLLDSLRLTSPKRRIYTYCHTDNRARSRIDRMYVDVDISARVEASNFEISCFSDHKILKTRIGNNIERGPGSWVFNNTLLRDIDFIQKMRSELSFSETIKNTYRSKREFWDYLKMNIQSISAIYSNEKAKTKRLEINKITKEIEFLENIPTNLLSIYEIQKLGTLKKKMEVHEKNKLEGIKLRAKIPKHDYGEPKISYLSKLEKIAGERNTLYSLRDENNNLKAGSKNLLTIVHQFYKKLYTKEPEDIREQDKFLNGVTTQISRENLVLTEKDLEEQELYSALKDLQKNKSPGHDGITVECMLFFWNELKVHFMDALNETKLSEELSNLQKRGAIRISFKKGNRDELKNYRPITLLNVDLKIISRALALRLSKVIISIVHICQKALPGRQITDNIHLVQDLINHINKNNECAAFIFYDQEKAFDRMSHNFIIKTLKSFGFGEKYIGWVKILLNDIKSFVKVNGFETFEFDIQRGVRQGCPLSALLYALTSEVLAIELRKNRNIKGYIFNGQEFKLCQYADDLMTAITDIASLGEIFDVLRKFELATNAKLNKTKTEALWVGGWRNRLDTPYGIKWKNDYVNFLGVYVGNMTTRTEREIISNINFDEIGDKIEKKIAFWKKSGISVKGKIRIINTFILHKVFYRLECVDMLRDRKTSLERKIRGLIWEDRKVCRVNFNVLFLSYEKGGLQLFDIETRCNAMRIKWVAKLLKKDNKCIERYVVDNLIGGYRGINGLKILNHDIQLNYFRNIDPFYKKCIKIWRSAGINFLAANIRTLRNEIIYRNNLLVDNENNSFPFFSSGNNQSVLPRYFKDLPVTHRLTSLSYSNRETIRKLNRSFWNLSNTLILNQGPFRENCHTYTIDDRISKIEETTFKDIYNCLINAKELDRPWETKWNALLRYYTLDLDEAGWKSIWVNIHDNLIPYDIQSTIWSILHLNFYCGYKEKLFGYGDGKCKLCGEFEEGSYHIAINCVVLERLLYNFITPLRNLNGTNISKDEMAFGMAGVLLEPLGQNEKLRNLVTFTIRTIVFKNRYKDFGGLENAIIVLNSKIKCKMRQIFHDYWIYYKHKGEIQAFQNKYLIYGIFGSIDNGALCLTI